MGTRMSFAGQLLLSSSAVCYVTLFITEDSKHETGQTSNTQNMFAMVARSFRLLVL